MILIKSSYNLESYSNFELYIVYGSMDEIIRDLESSGGGSFKTVETWTNGDLTSKQTWTNGDLTSSYGSFEPVFINYDYYVLDYKEFKFIYIFSSDIQQEYWIYG